MPESNQGWAPEREREKEREGERELGEGLRAREEGSREERAERRVQTQAEGTEYLLHHGTARGGKRREPPIQGTRQQSPSRSQVPK